MMCCNFEFDGLEVIVKNHDENLMVKVVWECERNTEFEGWSLRFMT